MRKNIYGVLLLACSLSLLTGCVEGGMPADTWIIEQYSSISDIKSYCAKLDDVVTLYLSDGITQEVYLTGIKQLGSELADMERVKEEVSIKPGTFTETTMAAKEGYDDIWSSLRTLINAMESDVTVLEDKDALSYLYLAYQEQLEIDLEKYINGYDEAAEAGGT